MNKKIKNIIRESLLELVNPPMKLTENVEISEELEYHLDNNISLSENVFRIYSDGYFKLINEVRDLYNRNLIRLNDDDTWIVESDLGKRVKLNK